MCSLISLAHIVIHDIKQEMRGDKRLSQLTQLQLASKTIYDILRDATPRILYTPNVESTTKLMDDFTLQNSYTASVVEAAISNDNNKLVKSIITLWQHIDEKEEKKAIHAALCIALQLKAILAATIVINNAMETKDANAVPTTYLNTIQKEQKKLGDKQMVILKKQFAKNYFAEGKTKFLSATKNDQESTKIYKSTLKKKKTTATPKQGKVTFS